MESKSPDKSQSFDPYLYISAFPYLFEIVFEESKEYTEATSVPVVKTFAIVELAKTIKPLSDIAPAEANKLAPVSSTG